VILTIPTSSDPSYFQTTTLEGSTYGLQFDFNQRCSSWYMSIADASGVDIYNGVKLITGFLLLRRCKDPRKPPGDFFVVSGTSDQSPPAQTDLVAGGRCSLLYITSDWLAIVAAGGYQSLVTQLQAGAQATTLSTYGSK
jgi:hypothetical protein